MKLLFLIIPAFCLAQETPPPTIKQFGPFRQPPFNARGPGFTLDGPNDYVSIYYNNIPFLGKIPYPTLTALDNFDFESDGFENLDEGALSSLGRAAIGFDDPRLNPVPPYFQAIPLPDHVGNDLGGDPNIRAYLAQINERSRQSHQRRYDIQKEIDNPFIPVPPRAEWFDTVSPPPFAGIGKQQRKLRDSVAGQPAATTPKPIPTWASRAKSLPTHSAGTGDNRWWSNTSRRTRRRKRDAVHPAAYSSGDLPVYRHNVLPISRGNTVLALDQNGNLRRGNDFWSLLTASNQNARFPLDEMGSGISQGTFGIPVAVSSIDSVDVGPFKTAVGSSTNVDTQLFGGKPGQYGRLSALNPIGVGFGNNDVVQFPFGGVRHQNRGYVNIDLPYKQSPQRPSDFPLNNRAPVQSRFPATLPTLDKINNPDPSSGDLDEFTEFINAGRPRSAGRWKRLAM